MGAGRPEVLDALRARTRAAHERIERGVALARGEGDAADLRRFLERLHGLQVPLEERLARLPWTQVGLDFEERRKAALLARDLEALGHDVGSIASLPRCERLPRADELPQGLGCLHLARKPMDLGALTREVVGRFAEEAPELELRGTGDPVGDWDAARLDQVLTNLLSNAVKYGLGRPIEVAVSGDPMGVRVAVTDRGIGIPLEGRERLFGRFERAVAPSAYQGLGLGLWIARTLVEMHGGDIMVESAPGMGATFTVTLPKGSIRDREARPA